MRSDYTMTRSFQAALSGLVLLFLLETSAIALTFIVNSNRDEPDANPGDRICETAPGNGVCTLRAAIEEHNASRLFANVIQFNIGAGTPTIRVGSATGLPLPPILGQVTISGNTGGADRVELDGSLAGPDPALNNLANGLTLLGGDNLIESVVINRFISHGILISGTGPPGDGRHRIQNSLIGTDATGTQITDAQGNPLGNGCDGVHVESRDNLIGQGNVLSGNGLDGVRISGIVEGVRSNRAQGNAIGTDVNGTLTLGNGTGGMLAAVLDLAGPQTQLTDPTFAPLSNCVGLTMAGTGLVNRIITMLTGAAAGESRRIIDQAGMTITVADFSTAPAAGDTYLIGDGVSIGGTPDNSPIPSNASENTIGGNIAGQQNLISGNGNGVSIIGPGADQNRVQANTIGANRVRSLPLPNRGDGVAVREGARNNVIRENHIEGNAGRGVRITSAHLTEILGNFIGSASLPNAEGILIEGGAQTNLVSLNFIGNNLGNGITLRDAGTEGNSVTANNILGNEGNGVVIRDHARFNIVGGLIREALNAITGNLGIGVAVVDDSLGNPILMNSIFDNGTALPLPPGFFFLGIDLTEEISDTTLGDGPTPNDAGDGDTGPNRLQNVPVLTSATSDGSTTTIEGSLNTAPDDTLSPLPAATTFRIEFFANRTCDPSGFGEGETPLGATEVVIDGSGNAGFSAVFPIGVSAGEFITSTATSLTPNPVAPDRPLPTNTSEFSECIPLQGGVANQPPVAHAGPDQTVRLGSLVTLNGAASFDPDNGPGPLGFAWTQTAGPNVILTGANTDTPTFTPTVAGINVFRLVVNDGQTDSLPDTVTITVPILGDIDLDGDVDNNDLNFILAARNTPAGGPNDLRDLNGDGRIDALDARRLVTLCSRPRCATV